MAIRPTNEDYQLIQLRTRNNRIRIELLNFNYQTIDSLEGNATEGSISVDANSDIRRSCSISMVVNRNSLKVAEDSEIWMERYVKIYQGIDNPKTKQTKWWNMGLFLINKPTRTFNPTTNTLSFDGLDLMSKLTGARNGQLPAMTTLVPVGSNIADVVRDTIVQQGGFTNYIIEDVGNTVPYDIKMDTGATVYELLVKLRDLYSGWEMFFDVDGVFHFQRIPSGVNDPVVIDFEQLNQDLILDEEINLDFENVKNNIIVYGRLLDTGEQIMATSSDEKEDSPFAIQKIGKINYIVTDEQIYNNKLAQDRANYELFLHARMNDEVTLNVVPIPWLNDVNVKIACMSVESNQKEEFLIKSLNIPLNSTDALGITAIKVYSNPLINVYFEQDMKKWSFKNSSQFSTTYDVSDFSNVVAYSASPNWGVAYLEMVTVPAKQYTLSFNCEILTPYKTKSSYQGIAYQILNKVEDNDNFNNLLSQGYLVTSRGQKEYSISFLATSQITYFALNFGMVEDNRQIGMKIGNFKMYYEV